VADYHIHESRGEQFVDATREERTRIVHVARETARLAGIAAGKSTPSISPADRRDSPP